jgi:glycosyltransferase involved in cell wall biosynthesis
MARAADVVIVPSEFIKSEACERFKLPATKVFAVPEAAREFFKPAPVDEIDTVENRFGISEAFVFAVGTIEPRKNYLMLIEAFENVVKSRPELQLQLVIAGARGWASEHVLARIEKSPVRTQIILTGYLTDIDLRALYSSCTASAYPSQYEGFGLPPLEAMACGAPVIASNIPSIAEVAGNAARLVDPFDASAWARQIIELVVDREVRASQISAGFNRVAQFSWQIAATKTYEVYKEAMLRWRSNKSGE